MSRKQPAPASGRKIHSHLDPADRYKAGTLQYTKAGLITIFFWLLWGDFTFTLMEAVVPSIIPLKLHELGASNFSLSFIVGTIAYSLNFVVNPVVSFKSDRCRTRWGRRIPFLFLATPPIALALLAMAFSPEIGQWVYAHLGNKLGVAGSVTVIVVTIGVLTAFFQFFNMFVSSVYYYILNDVVPEHFLARFMALFRVVGILAGMMFNYFVYEHALTHMRAIFICAAALYFVGFMLMCWRVKEGKYPPPPALEGNRTGVLASIQTYFRECFTHPFYLCIFAFSSCSQVAGACGFVASLFYLHLGIDLKQLGHFHAYMAIPSIVLAYPIGVLADRYNPVRVVAWSMWLFPLLSLASFFVVHDYPTMVVMTLVAFPAGAFSAAAVAPMIMLLFPKERYGQFGSADAMMRSLSSIVMSLAAGLFMDMLKRFYHGNEEYYRWMYVWTACFQVAAFFFIWRVYRYWKQYGGDEYYVPPAVGSMAEVKAPPVTATGEESHSVYVVKTE